MEIMEPLYEYVKGEGWKQVPRNLVTLACGTVVTVERKETYFYVVTGL